MRNRKRQGRAAVRSGSIRRRLLLMLMVLLLLQTAVYLLVFFKGGVQGEARKNAFSIFREQTANRALDLGNDMVERWSNTREGENSDRACKAGQSGRYRGICVPDGGPEAEFLQNSP